MSESRIPVANIYYMLSYAWDIQPSWERKHVEADDYETLWELLARLLLQSVDGVFKRGLAKDYINRIEEIFGVKGKMDIGSTFLKGSWEYGKTWCSFDEFVSDIFINQAIKATIYRILKSSRNYIEKQTSENLKRLYQRFGEISLNEEVLLKRIFTIRLNRHQMHYRLPIEICKFILLNSVFRESDGQYTFIDFERDHGKMSALFEKFIFNYYARHHKEWRVKHEIIYWKVSEGGVGVEFLPEMRTDVTLEKKDRKIVIDAKFYHEPMKSKFSWSPKKFTAANLYQLSTYLSHVGKSESHACNETAEGILLYPVVETIPRLDVNMLDHRIRVESVNLNQPWREISDTLSKLLM